MGRRVAVVGSRLGLGCRRRRAQSGVQLGQRAMSPLAVLFECLRLHYLATVAAHHQVEVIMAGVQAKDGHVWGERGEQKWWGEAIQWTPSYQTTEKVTWQSAMVQLHSGRMVELLTVLPELDNTGGNSAGEEDLVTYGVPNFLESDIIISEIPVDVYTLWHIYFSLSIGGAVVTLAFFLCVEFGYKCACDRLTHLLANQSDHWTKWTSRGNGWDGRILMWQFGDVNSVRKSR